MNEIVYYLVCFALIVMVLVGIYLMSKVKLSRIGNGISAVAMLLGVVLVLIKNEIFVFRNVLSISVLFAAIAIGTIIGLIFNAKVKMIQMPQMVALLNGIGGAASALVGTMSLIYSGNDVAKFVSGNDPFSLVTSALAISVGIITLIGSLIAAGKLHRILPQKPIVIKGHQIWTLLSLVLTLALCVLTAVKIIPVSYMWIMIILNFIVSGAFGALFSMRVGGADMPITISLLNSLSGVAGAIAGLAINNLLLVAIGGIVGASGLLLTQIMCKAINRSLIDILLGRTSAKHNSSVKVEEKAETQKDKIEVANPSLILANAKDVIIVPGYGMAIAQAQHLVKKLADKLESKGARVRYAIHPVAGRMPGHMNVLLCEADVDYESLYEMKDIDEAFATADACVVVGANDVTNPAARVAVGTPIYGMPILSVDKCKNVFIFNYDTKPGYAGVENTLYSKDNGVYLYLGDAQTTLNKFLLDMDKSPKQEEVSSDEMELVRNAKKVIIVPGYGMAIAQAQHLVKRLADKLEGNGAEVKYAIHPVAGRMPGHMNVLLCEADVDYESLYEMKDIDDEFQDADVCIVVGANDVTNPAARVAVGTPIYGMPILSVDKCKNIFIFNYDTKPGYAGVDNPLYTRKDGAHLYLGNAAQTLQEFISKI
ncbi:MAG TPA: NAD(P)(+) transhydrogenase (Re/Si-specific) subunit beta [Clostridia bacterium]|nr:NAD(P)(+) transhydrogenase (Re/Si-specific) subunit beta [Clostridia bacterium]